MPNCTTFSLLLEMIKKLKKLLLLNCLPFLAKWVIRFLKWTIRATVVGEEHLHGLSDKGQNAIYVFWHDQMLLMGSFYQGRSGKVLISNSEDGEIIARIMAQLGFGAVRGSSSRGGRAALKKMIEISRENFDIIITPDGPRGPRHKIKIGTAQLARLTRIPVVCASMAYSHGFRFASWDRFLLPFPFSKAVLSIHEPLFFDENKLPEEFLVRLEKAMSVNQLKADELLRQYGLHPV